MNPETTPLVLGVVAVVAFLRRQWPRLDGWKVIPVVLGAAALVAFGLAPWRGWLAYAQLVALLTIGAMGGHQLAARAGAR